MVFDFCYLDIGIKVFVYMWLHRFGFFFLIKKTFFECFCIEVLL